MSKVQRILGFIWAAPVTVVGLLYVTLFTALGWYKHSGTFDDAVVWNVVADKAPKWLNGLWLHWSGHTVGNVVVMKPDVGSDRFKLILRHEQEHVHQCMVLGVFQPLLYSAAYMGLKFCRYAHPYYDNPFEIDARRAAGQVIDVIGALKRAVADGTLKLPPPKAP